MVLRSSCHESDVLLIHNARSVAPQFDPQYRAVMRTRGRHAGRSLATKVCVKPGAVNDSLYVLQSAAEEDDEAIKVDVNLSLSLSFLLSLSFSLPLFVCLFVPLTLQNVRTHIQSCTTISTRCASSCLSRRWYDHTICLCDSVFTARHTRSTCSRRPTSTTSCASCPRLWYVENACLLFCSGLFLLLTRIRLSKQAQLAQISGLSGRLGQKHGAAIVVCVLLEPL
jgi:hypothetical protein